MKEETNNEMDLLLRRLGRRSDESVSDANGDLEHLDADELNAYAENVLPAAARARYTEHLAECARCRELIVQLSSSAGVVPVVETVKAAEPSALKKFLASLSSPLVWRYAVPALGLIIVAAIGLFVLQQNKQRGSLVAQDAAPSKYTGVAAQEASEPPGSKAKIVDQIEKEPAAPRPSQRNGSPANETAAAAPQPPPASALSGNVSRDDLAKKEQEPAEAPAAAAPKPNPTADTAERQARIESREETSPARAANEPQSANDKIAEGQKGEDRKAGDVKDAPAARAASKTTTFSALGNAQSAARAREAKDNEAESQDNDDSNTTTVAGRRFRKQGGVWVDTAYNFSRTAISITRGSEQYRALIADEPAIKTIADQLDGEILVLWKGRAYRIR